MDTGGIRKLENLYRDTAPSCKAILVLKFITELFVVAVQHGGASFYEQPRQTHRDHAYHAILADLCDLSVLRCVLGGRDCKDLGHGEA